MPNRRVQLLSKRVAFVSQYFKLFVLFLRLRLAVVQLLHQRRNLDVEDLDFVLVVALPGLLLQLAYLG